jgi:hypothetical protein
MPPSPTPYHLMETGINLTMELWCFLEPDEVSEMTSEVVRKTGWKLVTEL